MRSSRNIPNASEGNWSPAPATIPTKLSGRGLGQSLELDACQMSAIARLFSSSVFHEMAKKGRSPLFARLVDLTGVYSRCGANDTVADAFDMAFDVLKIDGLRDEYVYRSALTHRVLMGKHSLKTATMLNEFRAGACKADLVVLNGTATVYEIKSERDTLARLRNQLDNYKRVFAKIYVIASESHVPAVLETTPGDVGVLMLSSRYHISTVREATDRPDRICPVTLFESLQASEAVSILKILGIAVPSVPNTKRHSALRNVFENLDPTAVHKAMVVTLKRTRALTPLSSLVDRLPRSLHTAALSIRVRRADYGRILEAVSTPLNEAMTWS